MPKDYLRSLQNHKNLFYSIIKHSLSMADWIYVIRGVVLYHAAVADVLTKAVHKNVITFC